MLLKVGMQVLSRFVKCLWRKGEIEESYDKAGYFQNPTTKSTSKDLKG